MKIEEKIPIYHVTYNLIFASNRSSIFS